MSETGYDPEARFFNIEDRLKALEERVEIVEDHLLKERIGGDLQMTRQLTERVGRNAEAIKLIRLSLNDYDLEPEQDEDVSEAYWADEYFDNWQESEATTKRLEKELRETTESMKEMARGNTVFQGKFFEARTNLTEATALLEKVIECVPVRFDIHQFLKRMEGDGEDDGTVGTVCNKCGTTDAAFPMVEKLKAEIEWLREVVRQFKIDRQPELEHLPGTSGNYAPLPDESEDFITFDEYLSDEAIKKVSDYMKTKNDEIEKLKTDYLTMKEAGQSTLTGLLDERAKLRRVLEYCARQCWDGCDIDGGCFQDMMVKEGLMKEVDATDEFKAEWDADTMYVLAWKDREVKT